MCPSVGSSFHLLSPPLIKLHIGIYERLRLMFQLARYFNI